jgi:hypothetical protein
MELAVQLRVRSDRNAEAAAADLDVYAAVEAELFPGPAERWKAAGILCGS